MGIPERRSTPLSVLVIDDDGDGAESMAVLLQMSGHRVTTAADGEAALRAAEAADPDAVLLDIRLPRIDGWEVARRLRERPTRKKPLFIAITGCSQLEDQQKSHEAGIDLHLLKPVDPQHLLTVLEQFSRTMTAS
jgi:CheY-like chemotaxis protein